VDHALNGRRLPFDTDCDTYIPFTDAATSLLAGVIEEFVTDVQLLVMEIYGVVTHCSCYAAIHK
jgi:hypothetical protein